MDLHEIAVLDIAPLFADGEGVMALDACIRVALFHAGAHSLLGLVIRSYPKRLKDCATERADENHPADCSKDDVAAWRGKMAPIDVSGSDIGGSC